MPEQQRNIITLSRRLTLKWRGGPRIAHWAVAIGQWPLPDLFLEIYAEGGTFWSPFMRMRVCKAGDPIIMSGAFKTFGHMDTTSLTDDQIAAVGADYVERNPVYSIRSNNCQHFVQAVVEGITAQARPRAISRGFSSNTAETPVVADAIAVQQDAKGEAGKTVELTLDTKQLEPHQAEVVAVNNLLKTSGLPDLDVLINAWMVSVYADVSEDGAEDEGSE